MPKLRDLISLPNAHDGKAVTVHDEHRSRDVRRAFRTRHRRSGHQLEFDADARVPARCRRRSVRGARAGALRSFFGWYELTPSEASRVARGATAVGPPDHPADDIAACMVPGLFRRTWMSWGSTTHRVPDARRPVRTVRAARAAFGGVSRDFNRSTRWLPGPRRPLTPAAMIPMTTPEQAIAELDHAVVSSDQANRDRLRRAEADPGARWAAWSGSHPASRA